MESHDWAPGEIIRMRRALNRLMTPDPRDEALLFVGFLWGRGLDGMDSINRSLGWWADYDEGTDGWMYYVEVEEVEGKREIVFSSLVANREVTYLRYAPGAWEKDLAFRYRLYRKVAQARLGAG